MLRYVLVGSFAVVSSLAKANDTKTTTVAKVEAPQAVTFTNELVNGKKAWLPATVQVKHGRPVTLTLKNTLNEPHGFEVPGMTKPVVVAAGKTETITVDAKDVKSGTYDAKCQLHPAHVGAQVTVE